MRTWITASFCICLALGTRASALEIHAPRVVTAGSGFSIATSGSGKSTFYLTGPYSVSKRTVDAGADISVDASEVEHAGRYSAVLCSDQCSTAHFYVQPSEGSRISLLVHPSRVPVADTDAISAVAFVFDRFHNLSLAPRTVEFKLVSKEGGEISQARSAANGVAWGSNMALQMHNTTMIQVLQLTPPTATAATPTQTCPAGTSTFSQAQCLVCSSSFSLAFHRYLYSYRYE